MDPERLTEPSPLEHRGCEPMGRNQREHEVSGRDARHEQPAEHHRHDDEGEPNHHEQVDGQRVRDALRGAVVDRRLAGDAELDAASDAPLSRLSTRSPRL